MAQACTTVEKQTITIPDFLFAKCEAPEFKPSDESVREANDGNWRLFSIEQAQYALQLKKEIFLCSQTIENLKRYSGEMASDAD
jgi:hypothetical protein